MKVRWIIGLAAIVAVGAFAVGSSDRLARVPTGYVAKMTCSEVFVAGRSFDAVTANDFEALHPTIPLVDVSLDEDAQSVSTSLFGLGGAVARHRVSHGCTLTKSGAPLDALAPLAPDTSAVRGLAMSAGAAGGGETIARVDATAIDAALDTAFADDDANHRAVLAMVDGELVAERYAPGFDADTPFVSWSMAKSITVTLVGVAVGQGLLDVQEPAPIPAWSDDERARITWNDLMRMQSGLAFQEDYGDPGSDVNQMLFNSVDASAVAAGKPASHAPGEVWYYSSGTTNVLSRALTSRLQENSLDLFAFAQDKLFRPIGATSFVLEPDASGLFLGSSYAYATARDWARLGQLYLQEGQWGGADVLPVGWRDYAAEPTAASDGQYGASFWLNWDGAEGRERFLPGLPEDVFFMSGHEGQYVIIIPSKRMVIVRTGLTRDRPPLDAVQDVVTGIFQAVTLE